MSENITAVVLAAGAGTRMKSEKAKVLHELGGRSMVAHALAAVSGAGITRIVAVVGHDREQVSAHVAQVDPRVHLAVQAERNGTGHAVGVALESLADLDDQTPLGTVLVTYADVPLLESGTLIELLETHRESGAAVTVLTSELDNPSGYGRIIRDSSGAVRAIREQKDASSEEQTIREVNSGIFALDGQFLTEALTKIGTDNAQGEVYLTDVVGIAADQGLPVGAHVLEDIWQAEGVNDRAQLARLGAELNRRITNKWMCAGVTIVDPSSTWIDTSVTLEPDASILPETQLFGATTIATGCMIGPGTTLRNVEVHEGATVTRTHGSDALIGADANVGPFSYLRPGTELGAGGKIGAFVETKNAQIGDGAKVPHLSYVGDAQIGDGANIGAGTIFANYDGVNKHHSTVGRHARTSSNNTFVAPVNIGDGAFTGAGTTVRNDVPPGALAVGNTEQRNIEGWVVTKRPGTTSAQAAQESQAAQKTRATQENDVD